ncbi:MULTISPECIES: DUF4176 domain-containing protein [Bacillus cereus group]|nr:DUF4176 domain-containing protein [Bacillus mycoides]MBJ8051035.1 hypothetical protein [Bacillus cereus]
MGCPYPDFNYLFNLDDIQEVVLTGYEVVD